MLTIAAHDMRSSVQKILSSRLRPQIHILSSPIHILSAPGRGDALKFEPCWHGLLLALATELEAEVRLQLSVLNVTLVSEVDEDPWSVPLREGREGLEE